MEEKERFELFGEHCIKDNNPDARCQLLDAYVACVILNEQDKENQQIKQQLHDLPKKIVVEIREKVNGLWYFVLEEQKEYFEGNRYVLSQKDFNEILDTILKKYGDKQ